MRSRGVDVRDAQAVRGELEELGRLPYAERVRLLSLPHATDAAEPDAGSLAERRGRSALTGADWRWSGRLWPRWRWGSVSPCI